LTGWVFYLGFGTLCGEYENYRLEWNMKIESLESIEQQPVTMPGSSACQVRYLVGPKDGAPNFAMRQFEVAPGGFTPKHSHPYEHEVYVLSGKGTILEGNLPREIKAGDVIYVAPDEIHQFRNASSEPLKFLCLVPNSSQNLPATLAPECGVEAVS
jgi:quercetin dioxygenase-like cupin family protein